LGDDTIVPSPVIKAYSSPSRCLGRLCSRTVLLAVECAGEKQSGGEEGAGFCSFSSQ
ncbi:unnamed protein product, partial [Bubo scandiacus]